MGAFTLTLKPGIEPELLTLLLMGQAMGIGQRRTSGFGKYWLSHRLNQTALKKGLQPHRIQRAQTLLEIAMQEPQLHRAIVQMEEKPNIDELTEKTQSQVLSAAGQMRSQQYHPPPLQAFTIPKSDGSERMLAVSPLYDRILQKAATLTLTPGLDALMSQASYGYRKGLSRQQVRYEIQNAYRQGYHWVFESDIDDFFDAVYRPQLYRRLKSLFGEDPLWDTLEAWLGAEIHFKQTIVERTPDHGLPQGSPLSPLLANFILDDFDSDMEAHGFKLIRFADDFIILCKSQVEAQHAAEGVKASLKQVRLQLNIDKTHIVHLKQGFKFLGYLFREDHAIEVAGDTSDGRNTFSAEDAPQNLPAWLANIGENTVQPLQDEDLPKNHIGEIEEQGLHIVLAGDAQILTTDNHNLVIKKEDIITQKVSWELIHSVTLIGLHSMTLPAQHQALAHKIPVHLADRSGRYLGALTSFQPAQNSYKNWFIQLQISDRPDFCLNIAKEIVQSRIHNQRTSLIKRKGHKQTLKSTLEQLKKLYFKVQGVEKLSSLNGLEGTATRLYLQAHNLFLPEWAQFEKRTRRPPTDPFNVLLSLGYTILYSHVDSILQSAGFLTWKGLYHQQSAAHAALASDLMESYRHIVERYAVYVINHGQIKEEDFKQEEQPYNKTPALRLSAEARRRYVTGLLQRFDKFSTQQTLHQHLYEQAKLLKTAMHNQNAKHFKAWKQQK
jgi:group II intron reverse transcriptase/maturase/CRISPR-associated endonuclease Cas1